MNCFLFPFTIDKNLNGSKENNKQATQNTQGLCFLSLLGCIGGRSSMLSQNIYGDNTSTRNNYIIRLYSLALVYRRPQRQVLANWLYPKEKVNLSCLYDKRLFYNLERDALQNLPFHRRDRCTIFLIFTLQRDSSQVLGKAIPRCLHWQEFY